MAHPVSQSGRFQFWARDCEVQVRGRPPPAAILPPGSPCRPPPAVIRFAPSALLSESRAHLCG
jgi:hypothetical protein